MNYRRRQSFFNDTIDWSFKDLYNEFKGWIGSSVAQQLIRKNKHAWSSFFALLKLKIQGRLPPEIEHVGPPGYWKDRKTGLKNLIILIRNDLYSINGHELKVPKKVNPISKVNGNPQWSGKQCELECIYDRVKKRWYAHQPITVEPVINQSSETKRAFVDLGIVCPIASTIEGDPIPIAFNGRPIKSDWLYWAKTIDRRKSVLKKVNDKSSSRKIDGLFKKRKRRYRHALNTVVNRFVKKCSEHGIAEIVVGELTGILRNDKDSSKEMNMQRHNLWSHKYLFNRLRMTAENFGIKVVPISEAGTSSVCPGCGSCNVVKHKRLLKCFGDCKKEWHRDVAGAINLSIVHGCERLSSNRGECDNGVMAHPLFIPYDGVKPC